MTTSHTPPFTANLTIYGSNYIYDYMGLDDKVVRKWRDRGFFTGGEKNGRQYLYTILDVAKLMIMRELVRRGFKLSVAAEAAETGAVPLVAQALYRETLMEVVAKTEEDAEAIINLIQTDNQSLTKIFFHIGVIWSLPQNYLVTGGDDCIPWLMIDDLKEFDHQSNEYLAYTHIDLRLLANRMIQVLYDFNEGTKLPVPPCQDWKPCVLTFETKDCWKSPPRILGFSTNPEINVRG